MNCALGAFAAALKSPAPWLSPYLSVGQQVLAAPDASSVAAALNAAGSEQVRFVEQSALPAGESYEAFIARTRRVPTRDNLHDLFNGLIWLSYPLSKRRLNELHAGEISIHGTSGARGPLRDALTVFDENGAVMQAPEELVDALRRRDWHRLFVTGRHHWQSARFALFGHALLEKLVQPRKPITAHVWIVADMTDDHLAASLTSDQLATRNFLPLPVLGVPGWWSGNEQPSFYDDTDVFRPLR